MYGIYICMYVYVCQNPAAASAASAAAKSLVRKSSRKEDGSAKCQRKGCQKTFIVAENAPEACLCVYHKVRSADIIRCVYVIVCMYVCMYL